MTEPKIMYVYRDSFDTLSLLSDEQLGRLMKALFVYAETGMEKEFDDDLALKMMFRMMRKQVDRDFQKYKDECERRSAAAKKAAQARWNKDSSCDAHTNASV